MQNFQTKDRSVSKSRIRRAFQSVDEDVLINMDNSLLIRLRVCYRGAGGYVEHLI